MARRQTGGTLLPWLSAKADGKEKRFIMVGNTILLDKRFQDLSAGARQLYLCLCMESGGKREVEFPHGAAKKYGFAKTSFDRYIRELETKGFVEKIESGELYQFSPNAYRFSLAWKLNSAPQFGEPKA